MMTTVRLLEIELPRRPPPDDQAGEDFMLRYRALLSFEMFARLTEAISPIVLVGEPTRLAWVPWVQAARITMSTGSAVRNVSGTLAT